MPPMEGPYRMLTTAEGKELPFYVIPFDKEGRCKAPRTRGHLIEELKTGGNSHVFLFSHGWNNDWMAASERYVDFMTGYSKLRREYGLAVPAGYTPLLIGVFWPSTSLVLPWESAPRFAGRAGATASAMDQDRLADDEDQAMAAFAADLAPSSTERFYELMNASELGTNEVRELAALLAPTLGADDELGTEGGDAADLAEAWEIGGAMLAATVRTDTQDDEDDDFGAAAPIPGVGPVPAGILSKLDPRLVLRMGTVWKMKDRAGTVGANGVHLLLRDLLTACDAAVHLIGHSYGCKVMLSALAMGPLSRPVTSVLLLQPAVSHRCFAADADGKGHPGGYRVVLERISQPLLTTFSRRDFALAKIFHLAVRRKSDLGEQRIAAGPPSRFAALGGYGPGGMKAGEDLTVPIKQVGKPYHELGRGGLKILALNGDRTIGGHGDVLNEFVWWALYEQVRSV